MDGRFDSGAPAKGIKVKYTDIDPDDPKKEKEITIDVPPAGNDIQNRNVIFNRGYDLIADEEEIGSEYSPFKSDMDGMDIHNITEKTFLTPYMFFNFMLIRLLEQQQLILYLLKHKLHNWIMLVAVYLAK